MASDFNFNIEPGTDIPASQASLAIRRKLAAALLQQGTDTSPVRAWTQGAARVAQGLLGGFGLGQADLEEANARKQAMADAMAGLNASGANSQPSPGVASTLASLPPAGAPAGAPPPARSPSPMPPAPVGPMPQVRQAMEGIEPIPQDAYAQDTFRTPLDSMRPSRDAMVAALTGSAPAPGAPPPMPPAENVPAMPVAGPAVSPAPSVPPQGGNRPIDPRLMRALGSEFLPPGMAQLASGQISRQLDPYGDKSFTNIEAARHNRVTEQQAATTPVKIGSDTWGSDIYAVRDPSAPSGYRVINAGAGGANPESAATSGVTGQDYLNKLPAERRAFIEKLANYEIDPRTLSIKGGHRERALADVAAFRPDYNQQNYAAAQEGLKKFQSGQQGNAIRSFNTAIEHLDQLTELGAALKNGDIPTINRIKNWWQTETGSSAPTNFEGLKGIVGQEVVKAIIAGGGSDRERDETSKRIAAASSPEQLAGIVATYKGAMGAQLKSLKLQYEQSTLRKDFDRLLSDKTKSELSKHQPQGDTASTPADPLGIR